MKNFIVPIDFSNESLSGLRMAVLFSHRKQVNIQMVYVQQKSVDYDRLSLEKEQEYAEENFQKIVKEFEPQLSNDSKLRYIIKKGRIYQEIVNQAQSYTDSVITSSTHGASGFQEFFIGSNTYRIISATDRPVITMRKNDCPSDIKKIVLPIDLSADTRQKVPFTTELGILFGAEIHVVGLHISKNERDKRKVRSYVSQVSGFIQGKVNCISNEVKGDSVAELVVNYANAVRADLISITTEKTTGLSLIIGNAAHQVLNKAEVPVLCLTPKNLRKTGGSFKTFGG